MIATATLRRMPRRTSHRTAGSRLTAMNKRDDDEHQDARAPCRRRDAATRDRQHAERRRRRPSGTPGRSSPDPGGRRLPRPASAAGTGGPAPQDRSSADSAVPASARTVCTRAPAGRQHAELVAFRVGEHHPAGVLRGCPMSTCRAPMSTSRSTSAGLVVRRQVEVQPVLARLRLGDRHEHDAGMGAVGAGPIATRSGVLERDPEAEHLGPPAGQPRRVVASPRRRRATDCPSDDLLTG